MIETTPTMQGVDSAEWDRLAGAADPFLSHEFMSIMEQSGSAIAAEGWQGTHVLAQDASGGLIGAVPLWLKGHSQGEYIFDHGWAEAWHRAGGAYYPKAIAAVPFTPVSGRRLLHDSAATGPDPRPALIAGMEAVADRYQLSSLHALFITEDEVPLYRAAGWLIRTGLQFHWQDQGYGDYGGFLAALSSRKRKALRKERRQAAQSGLIFRQLTGDAIRARHWDAMWEFYQDTGARKWGQPYLTRAAIDMLAEQMADRILLIMAETPDGEPVAGALNFIGEDTLYGRYWGCVEQHHSLHFELCYHQAIEYALAHGLTRVEAGAQGEHKLNRGYLPVPTYSAHHIPHPGFRDAITSFLNAETEAVEREIEILRDMGPFRAA
ncbi:MAG: GNAT family N-acetyltransferase [Alphaproteobacteria bacterium]